MKYFPWIAIAFVVIVVVSAFFVIDSPAHQRMVRFDEHRLNDLQNLSNQIALYFENKGNLPEALPELEDTSGVIVLKDPETGEYYEYTVNSDMQFRLCANFSLPMKPRESQRYISPYGGAVYDEFGRISWFHSEGRNCFDITVTDSEEGDRLKGGYPLITVVPATT